MEHPVRTAPLSDSVYTDDRLIRQVDEILAQNRLVLEANLELLKLLATPRTWVSADHPIEVEVHDA